MVRGKNKLLTLAGLFVCVFNVIFCAGSAFAAIKAIEIENTELYDALKYCAEVTPTYENPTQYINDNLASAVICPGLEKAVFNDAYQTITFASDEDYMAVEQIYLNGMGLKNVDELEKFENAGRIYVLYNEIEELNFLSDFLYGGPHNRQILVDGNHLRKYPSYYDYSRVFNEDNAYTELFGMVITVNAMAVSNQTIEDEYEGDSYEMLDFIAKTQANFDFVSNPPAFNTDVETQMAEAISAYYNSDSWLKLENATLGDDRKSLIPIDKTQDMKISYCRTWEETLASPIFIGVDDSFADAILGTLRPFHNGSDELACVLRATIKSRNVVPSTDTTAQDDDVEPGSSVPDVPTTSSNDTSSEHKVLVPNTSVGKDYTRENIVSGAEQDDYVAIALSALFVTVIGVVVKIRK